MTTPNLAVQDYLRDVASKLTNAGFGEKGAIVKTACEYLKISSAQLYRDLETNPVAVMYEKSNYFYK